MKTKMKAILYFLLPALEVRALRREVEDYEDQIVNLSNTVGELRHLVNSAPSFYSKAIRDDKFGAEIAEAVKAEAVAKLAPALSREYALTLDKIARTMPRRGPPGSALSAFDERAETYHVRIELPQLNYDMQIVGFG